MNNLDNLNAIKNLDKSNVLGSVEFLFKQCRHAWEEASKVKIGNKYRQAKNLVMTGMGGSGLGARLIESVFGNDLKIPLVRVNDYNLPAFVDSETLVICSSYSGSTEETIENARQAVAKKALWMAIGTGGKLLELAQRHKAPFYKITPQYNPSKQPRMAIGYSVIGQLALVAKSGIITLSKTNLDQIIMAMKQVQIACNPQVSQNQNPAKKLAKKMRDKIIFYIAARHLTGAIHTVKNQLSENAKAISARFDIPELNHFLMEGLKHPLTNKTNTLAFFANSDLYPGKIQQRVALTKEVVEKNQIKTYFWQAKAKTKLAQAFELIQFGAYVNFYLSMLYDVNPAPIPWVDYFKKKLRFVSQ